jgi:hypothetical protein
MNGTMPPMVGFPTAFDGPTALVTLDTHLLVHDRVGGRGARGRSIRARRD